MRVGIYLLMVGWLGLAGCASGIEGEGRGAGSPVEEERVPRPDFFSVEKSERQPVEFAGVVVTRLASDHFWCGYSASYQGVRYQIERVIAGPMQVGETVVVFHALVGPPLCEADEPILSKEIFKVGQRLRIKAERTKAGEFVGWEQADNAKVLTRGE